MKKTLNELSQMVRSQIVAPDGLIIAIHLDKLRGWHVTVYCNDPNLVQRTQGLAETVADVLRSQYDIAD